jgi:hypothetical protein
MGIGTPINQEDSESLHGGRVYMGGEEISLEPGGFTNIGRGLRIASEDTPGSLSETSQHPGPANFCYPSGIKHERIFPLNPKGAHSSAPASYFLHHQGQPESCFLVPKIRPESIPSGNLHAFSRWA